MRFIRKAMIGLAAFAALPLAAQGPVPAPAVKKTEAAVPAAKTQAAPASLDPKDLEAWMDGYLPYALERGRIPGAVVVVVRGGEVVLQKGYGYSDVDGEGVGEGKSVSGRVGPGGRRSIKKKT